MKLIFNNISKGSQKNLSDTWVTNFLVGDLKYQMKKTQINNP